MNAFTENIDFSKYGLDLDITSETKAIPQQFLDDIPSVTKTNSSITFNNPSGPLTFNLKDEPIGKGTYGSVWEVDSDNPMIVKILRLPNDPGYTYDVIQEILIQIIIYEATKDIVIPEIGLNGPFCPQFFYFGKDSAHLYIVMEKLDGDLKQLLLNKSSKPLTTEIIKDTTVQISKILSVLYSKLQFSHRDFKPDNIMYKLIDGRINIRFIDFGFSCLTYKKLYLRALDKSQYASKFKSCATKYRDLHSYFRYLLDFSLYAELDCPIKRIINILMSSNQTEPRDWAQTYYEYNRTNAETSIQKSENLSFDVVYKVFTSLDIERPSNACSKIASSWISNIVKLYDSSVPLISNEEFLTISADFTKPYIKKYVGGQIYSIWPYNTDPNALVSSLKYSLPISQYNKRRSLIDVPEDMVPYFFNLFLESQYRSESADATGEKILHKIARNPMVKDINDKIDLVLSVNSSIRFIYHKNYNKKTALEIALENNFDYAVDKLLSTENILDFFTSYTEGMSRSLVQLLITKRPDLVFKLRNSQNSTLLGIALFKNKEEIFNDIMALDPPYDYLSHVNKQGFSLVDFAMKANNIVALKALLDLNIAPNKDTVLELLAELKNEELVAKIFDKYAGGLDVNRSVNKKNTPMILAAIFNNITLVKKLLSRNAKLASKDHLGRTALHYAAINASDLTGNAKKQAFEIVQLLMETNPILPNIKNNSGKGPANPEYIKNASVREYIRSRKSSMFSKKPKNTNLKKGGTLRKKK